MDSETGAAGFACLIFGYLIDEGGSLLRPLFVLCGAFEPPVQVVSSFPSLDDQAGGSPAATHFSWRSKESKRLPGRPRLGRPKKEKNQLSSKQASKNKKA
ncbi:hypothetical protein PQR63_22075 [Herbaspirillum rhizosphaerae]|uniref:Uncharacterized protein n=1 Tax=Herbaspirillum rhizosphaerae TaxID=346179 RepID=A0ABW8ZFF9_9BURK